MTLDPQTAVAQRCESVHWRTSYPSRCRNSASYEENGAWWCGVHAPSQVDARREKRLAERNARWQAEKARRDDPYITIARLTRERDAALRVLANTADSLEETEGHVGAYLWEKHGYGVQVEVARQIITAIETGAIHNDQR